MDTYEAVMNVEGEADSEESYYRSLQTLINSGTWGLQGSNGRAMMDAIEAGYCALGSESARDYYGNFIPSRWDVQAGTKGSEEYVIARSPFERVLEDEGDDA